MDSATLISELARFFRENRKKIMLITLLTAVAVVLYSMVSSDIRNLLGEQTETENKSLEQPAVFDFYVLNEDGTTYENSALLEEHFLLDSVITEIEAQTGVSIKEPLLEQEKSGFQKTQYDRGILGISRNGASHVFTATTSVGTSEENLTVMEAYFDYLLTADIPAIEGKVLTVLKEPRNMQFSIGSEGEIVEVVDEGVNLVDVLLYGVVGVFAGLILGFFSILIFQLMRDVITYAFSFAWEEEDIYLKVSKSESNDALNKRDMKNLIQHPINSSKLILSQNELDIVANYGKGENVITAKDLSDLNPKNEFTECIIILDSNETEKQWYRRQRKLLRNYDARLKIVHFVP